VCCVYYRVVLLTLTERLVQATAVETRVVLNIELQQTHSLSEEICLCRSPRRLQRQRVDVKARAEEKGGGVAAAMWLARLIAPSRAT
jgi:hypothetical protein